MRVPGEQETIAFFESIGYHVKKQKGGKKKPDYWLFIGHESNLGTRHSSLLGIWAEWMPHAIDLINEDAMFRRFMSIYEKAGPGEKAELKDAVLADWSRPLTSKSLSPFREPPYPDTTDALPRDWKARVRKILAEPNGDAYFPARAYFALTALDAK